MCIGLILPIQIQYYSIFTEHLLPSIHADFVTPRILILEDTEITELEYHMIGLVLYLTWYLKQSQLKIAILLPKI